MHFGAGGGLGSLRVHGKDIIPGTSLVVQWLRLRLLQGTRVQSLVRDLRSRMPWLQRWLWRRSWNPSPGSHTRLQPGSWRKSRRRPARRRVNSFARAALTQHHKLSGSKQQTCIRFQLWRLKSRCWQGHMPPPGRIWQGILSDFWWWLPVLTATYLWSLPPFSQGCPLCVCISVSSRGLLIRTSVSGSRTCPHLVRPHLNVANYICKGPIST